MTMTPIATIADALIDFILSLLRDPAAAEEFAEDPEGSMVRGGVGGCNVADVRAVAPIIYDRPDVVARAPQTVYAPSSGGGTRSQASDPVERAIQNIVNNFHVDNRATVVDQSVNQNIWAKGDVNQIFDQEAVINTGDHGVTAGHDANVDNSTTDVGGDVNIGNTTTDTTIDGSFNDQSDNSDNSVDTDVDGSFNEGSTEPSAGSDTGSDPSVAADPSAISQPYEEGSDETGDAYDVDAGADGQVAAEDTSDVSATSVETPPEDPFVDDQP